VNDTIAIMGVPLAIYILRRSVKAIPVVLLFGLAFGISIGSVMTPIGNPQNLLIAIQGGIQLPFTTFVTILAIPTIINLLLTYAILRVYFRREILQIRYIMMMSMPEQNKESYDAVNSRNTRISGNKNGNSNHYNLRRSQHDLSNISNNIGDIHTPITSSSLSKISVIILFVTIFGFIVAEIFQFLGTFADRRFSISIITITAAIVLYSISKERAELIKSIDYSVLIFFAAMFVFTAGLWTSGLISEIMSYIPNPLPTNNLAYNNAIIATVSIAISQILSNVPFVALYNMVMIDNGFMGHDVYEWMMLAAASTVAGNLTILGAASNIIIIEAAESRGFRSFGYIEFLKVGSIITFLNVVIYYLFILLISYL
jgi:Na+/H+ antiporter NhaD/arsenite permease-like protein